MFGSQHRECESGNVPADGIKHEIRQDAEGLTTLCMAAEPGNDCRETVEPGSKLLHTFYVNSHYEALVIYYTFMDLGSYHTGFETDKEPYAKKRIR